MSLKRNNRLLVKCGIPVLLRRSNHKETHLGRWVRDNGDFQTRKGWKTLEDTMASAMEDHWDAMPDTLKERAEVFHTDLLTEKELLYLKSMRSRVSVYL